MGNIISGKCLTCGYNNRFNYGGNKANFKSYCAVPAINTESLEFENINYFTEKDNIKYLFYTDRFLKGKNQHQNTIRNFNLELNELNNYCPSCREYSLNFNVEIYTD